MAAEPQLPHDVSIVLGAEPIETAQKRAQDNGCISGWR